MNKDWLSEIEAFIIDCAYNISETGGCENLLCNGRKATDHMARMSRVLRELAKYIKALKRSAYYPSLQRRLEIQILSDDARELCVASRDETKE